ncbi:MAG: hypothetical protein CW338_07295 [Clostridiales bacterium]|nr:hypothetical protein [Clostridiales bacterium]
MYKKQLFWQRIICLAALIASALVFAYSLGIMTDLYDLFGGMDLNKASDSRRVVQGFKIFYDMQPFNRTFTRLSIVLMLMAVLLFITNTHNRRRYYISNYISTGLYFAGSIALTVWAHRYIDLFRTDFVTRVDFAGLAQYAEKNKCYYTESTFWFDIHYALFAVLLLIAALLAANTVLKVVLMKKEKELLKQGEEAAV